MKITERRLRRIVKEEAANIDTVLFRNDFTAERVLRWNYYEKIVEDTASAARRSLGDRIDRVSGGRVNDRGHYEVEITGTTIDGEPVDGTLSAGISGTSSISADHSVIMYDYTTTGGGGLDKTPFEFDETPVDAASKAPEAVHQSFGIWG